MTQRSLLPTVGFTLGVILLWILLRPSQAPDAASAQPAPDIEAATPDPRVSPEGLADSAAVNSPAPLERLTLPSEEDQQRDYVASLPSTSLRVHVIDPYGVLSAPCSLRVETRLPNSQRARAEQAVVEAGACQFDKLPAGRSWISLLCEQPGGEPAPLFEQAIELAANEQHEHQMDLTGKIAVVDVAWACPPDAALRRMEISIRDARIVSRQGESLFSGTLRMWAPLGELVHAHLDLAKGRYTEFGYFITPGWQVWRIELPTGALHLKWLGAPAQAEFTLAADPSQAHYIPSPSVIGPDGQHSFYWLRPGQYHLQNVKDGKRGMVGQLVEIGAEPVHLTLEPRPAGTLSFIWPDLPAWAEPGQTNTRLIASLYAPGACWPVLVSKSFSHLDEWRFDDVPVGDYDLVLVQALWTSRTRVTVLASGGDPVPLNVWRRQVNLRLVLDSEREEPAPLAVQWIGADGAVQHLSSFSRQHAGAQISWAYRTKSPSGPSRLLVTRADGRTASFDLTVGEAESEQQAFRLPE